jgi:hypothetical protein
LYFCEAFLKWCSLVGVSWYSSVLPQASIIEQMAFGMRSHVRLTPLDSERWRAVTVFLIPAAMGWALLWPDYLV